jgi:hypothetical protein
MALLKSAAGEATGEDVVDVTSWLRQLSGCPSVTHTLVATCANAVHGDERSSWFYVEADSAAGVARRRCVACAEVRPVLDSEQHWTYPPMWACDNCRNSLCEVAFGVHSEPSEDGPRVSWLAVAVRCVECGRCAGVTDVVVPDLPLAEVGRAI